MTDQLSFSSRYQHIHCIPNYLVLLSMLHFKHNTFEWHNHWNCCTIWFFWLFLTGSTRRISKTSSRSTVCDGKCCGLGIGGRGTGSCAGVPVEGQKPSWGWLPRASAPASSKSCLVKVEHFGPPFRLGGVLVWRLLSPGRRCQNLLLQFVIAERVNFNGPFLSFGAGSRRVVGSGVAGGCWTHRRCGRGYGLQNKIEESVLHSFGFVY